MKKKILWVSRHAMSQEQLDDLNKTFHRDVTMEEVETRNLIWAATGDAAADIAANQKTLRELIDEFNLIAGVFPPVVFEATSSPGRRFGKYCVLASPVSRQAPELRKGEEQIPFVHVRWVSICVVV